MKTHDFTTTLLVDQSPKEVFSRCKWETTKIGGRAKLKAVRPN